MTSLSTHGRALLAAVLITSCIAPGRPLGARTPALREQGALTFSDVPAPSSALRRDAARVERWRSTRFLDWLPGGAMLVEERSARTFRLEQLTSPSAKPQTLLPLSGPIGWAHAPRVGSEFAYEQSAQERIELFSSAAPDGTRQLTGHEAPRGIPVWSADGRRLAFYGAGPTGRHGAVYVVNLAGDALARLVVGALAGRWQLLDWSKDGKTLLLLNDTRPESNLLYVARVASGELTRVPLPPARILSARFTPDGTGIYFISDQQGEYEQLLRFDLHARTTRDVSAPGPWDVEQFAASADGRYIAYTIDDEGLSRLTVRDRRLKLDLQLPWLHDGVIENVRFDSGHRLGFSYETSRKPSAVYVYDADSERLTRWTRSAPGPLASAGLAAAQLIRYPTWDHVNGIWRMIRAYAYLPRGPGPAPVLVLLHAGHDAQFRPTWRPFIQFVVNELGYAVIAPNVRGSSGYGKSFRALTDGPLRADAVRDIGSLMVWIGMQSGLDVHRVVVMGRGYGGWLALNALATFDGHLRGGIDLAGIADLADYVTHAPEALAAARRAEFGDASDPAVAQYLREISPLGATQRIRQPVLIVQGLDGAGVRATDSQQLAYLLRFHGDRVWLLTASDTGDAFDKSADRTAFLVTAGQFLRRLAKK